MAEEDEMEESSSIREAITRPSGGGKPSAAKTGGRIARSAIDMASNFIPGVAPVKGILRILGLGKGKGGGRAKVTGTLGTRDMGSRD